LSTLTKVFTVLVSLLSIFLCGVVITFITNANDWKTAYQKQETIAKAAQIQALAAQMDRAKSLQRNQMILTRIQTNIDEVQKLNSELTRQLLEEKKSAADQKASAATAVETVKTLRETIQNMYDAQLQLQKALDQDRAKMIAAQTQMIELTRQLNGARVEGEQLKTNWRREIEKNTLLEDENANLRQKVEKVTLGPSEFVPEKRVTLTSPAKLGVPIRGQITEVRGEMVAISVGSASGVRPDMTFLITRGQRFLGNLKIIHVEPGEAVGQLDNQQGAVVKGDSVATGFNHD